MRKKENAMSGMVMCLGWCNKVFKSKDRLNIRFCKSCAKRRQSEMSRSPISPKHCTMEIADDF